MIVSGQLPFNPDSKKIVSGSSDRTVKIWDSQTGQCLKTFQGHNRPVLSVAFSSDGKTIASCGGHSMIKLWNVETGECVRRDSQRGIPNQSWERMRRTSLGQPTYLESKDKGDNSMLVKPGMERRR
ncbi:MAG: hypothetical protein HC917_10425 [Richelia sp. SM2_1_7]|nr:hypothetical protein [Richelia sp. SM2_1_7]